MSIFKKEVNAKNQLSILTYTYFDFDNNIIENFNIEKAIGFFSLSKSERSNYDDPKKGAHPFMLMAHQCISCTSADFNIEHSEMTKKILEAWKKDKNNHFPEQFIRFVFKFDCTEEMLNKFYNTGKFSKLNLLLVATREDIITKSSGDWSCGEFTLHSKVATCPIL